MDIIDENYAKKKKDFKKLNFCFLKIIKTKMGNVVKPISKYLEKRGSLIT